MAERKTITWLQYAPVFAVLALGSLAIYGQLGASHPEPRSRPPNAAGSGNANSAISEIERYLARPTSTARAVLVARLRNRGPAALTEIEGQFWDRPAHLQRELLDLLVEVGGTAAFDPLVRVAADDRADQALKADCVTRIGRIRASGTVRQLLLWREASGWSEQQQLLDDLALALADQRDLPALKDMKGAHIRDFERRVRTKLAKRKAVSVVATTSDVGELLEMLAPSEPPWRRLQVLRKLEKIGTRAAIGGITRTADRIGTQAPGTVQLNAVSATIRLAEKSERARQIMLAIVHDVPEGRGRELLGHLLNRYAGPRARSALVRYRDGEGRKHAQWLTKALAKAAPKTPKR